MNIDAFIPLLAMAFYVPVLAITLSNRPLQRQHKLFALFLVASIAWSVCDFLLRSDFLWQYRFTFSKLTILMFMWVGVQYHCFSSTFFPRGKGRWLPFAYASLAVVVVLAALNLFPERLVIGNDGVYTVYGKWMSFIIIPLILMLTRNIYIFVRRLKVLTNPVLYNQISSLILSLAVMAVFSVAALLPWGREFPITHFGGILNALILSYAAVRHQLLDIRFVMRRALAYITLGIIGTASYCLLLTAVHSVHPFSFDSTAAVATTLVAFLVSILVYRLRGYLFAALGRALEGQRYDYHRKLSEFVDNINNVFSLSQEGTELLELVTKVVGCSRSCLLFLEKESKDFVAQLAQPAVGENELSGLRLRYDSPVVEYLRREQRYLTRENLAMLPEFRTLSKQERDEIRASGAELFMPMVSRGRLIGILVLDKKQSGWYSLEDFSVLENVIQRVAVSMEKEYLRERLMEREEELELINRSSAILASSMDIQRTYDSFMRELKKAVDASWAAIVLVEGSEIDFLALSSDVGSAWRAGQRIPVKGTAIEWMATCRETVLERDLAEGSGFTMSKDYLDQGIRSIIYLPMVANERVIGSLIVASCRPDAYDQRDVRLLEELASQIAMPVKNSRLYAEVKRKARIDSLTGLLNRQSLDELLSDEVSRLSRYGGVFSMIILDLDCFKSFNDNWGHPVGDMLLAQIGKVLRGSIRGTDHAFRYGGDEFAILLPRTNAETAFEVAERVRKRVAEEIEAGFMTVTASLGLSTWPADGLGAQEIVAAADRALFRAKRNGGNQTHRYSDTLPSPDGEAMNWQDSEDSKSLSAIYALAAAVDARDHRSCSHSKKVNEYATAIAQALKLEPMETSRLGTCAFLHDIGKIGISGEILNKPAKLSDSEWEEVKAHPQIGAKIVSHVPQLVPCVPGILHHHERYDGNGYPRGLKGKNIPLDARILAVADSFAAITSERYYSLPLSQEEALVEMERGAGTQFDPDLVAVFSRIMKTPTSHGKVEWVEEVADGMAVVS